MIFTGEAITDKRFSWREKVFCFARDVRIQKCQA